MDAGQDAWSAGPPLGDTGFDLVVDANLHRQPVSFSPEHESGVYARLHEKSEGWPDEAPPTIIAPTVMAFR